MIGLFNDCFPPIMDGVAVTTANYAHWLNKKSQPVCVVTPQVPGYKDCTEYPVYRYMSLPIPMRRPYRVGFPGVDFNFKRMLSRQHFELAHAHCPFTSGHLALQIAREHDIPLVATFHSKYQYDFQRVVHSKVVVDWMIRNVVSFFNQADAVWIPQESVGETLREYGYKGEMTVVDNGNDFSGSAYSLKVKQDARMELGLPLHDPIFLFVGQHIWEKNTELIIRSIERLKYRMPFQMLFVGTGYARNAMERLVEELGLTKRVRFMGPVYDRDIMKKIYQSADLFLFPSRYDNAPLVVREAAALHTPSVLLRNSTASEIVVEGENGYLADESVESFSQAIEKAMQYPIQREIIANKAALSLARSWEDIADEVSDRYKFIISQHKHALHFTA